MANVATPLTSAMGDVEKLSDVQLLERLRANRDEQAFALLVARHGPMVLTVCRRVLHNSTDAEDAFQAVFLVLFRRLAHLRQPDRLPGWLHGVAYRTAQATRRLRGKRSRHEMTVAILPETHQPQIQEHDRELRETILNELHRLPETFRSALWLCDLDGYTRLEAARLLNIAEGTLSSRLHHGRKLLATRLEQLGYSLGLLGSLSIGSASAQVSKLLLERTVRLLHGKPSSALTQVSQGVITTMSNARNYLWAGAASVLVMLTGTVAWGVLAEIETQPPSIQSLQSTMPVVSPVLAHTLHADIEKSLPVVVKTVPEAGVEDVDPGIQEVRVTFSKKMSDGSWTWAQDLGYGKALTSSGKIFYDKDGKTCVMPVKLQPNTTYAVWLNGGRFMSFVDTDGNKSLPYLLVFRTGSGK